MTPYGWIGVWLLVVSVLAIVAEGVLAAVWGAAMAKRTRALSERIESERVLIEADIAKLRAALAETRQLWRPYRGVLRWVRHPLAIALLESYARRRVGAR